jgi:hypothetical protein
VTRLDPRGLPDGQVVSLPPTSKRVTAEVRLVAHYWPTPSGEWRWTLEAGALPLGPRSTTLANELKSGRSPSPLRARLECEHAARELGFDLSSWCGTAADARRLSVIELSEAAEPPPVLP